jgi:hypothetical protein
MVLRTALPIKEAEQVEQHYYRNNMAIEFTDEPSFLSRVDLMTAWVRVRSRHGHCD